MTIGIGEKPACYKPFLGEEPRPVGWCRGFEHERTFCRECG